MPANSKLLIQKIADVTVVDFQEASILDTVQIETIAKELYQLVDAMDRKKVVLDFSKVEFLSSSALGVLINMQRKAGAIKGEVAICGLRPQLKQVFDVMRLGKLFEIHPGEQEALRHFGVNA